MFISMIIDMGAIKANELSDEELISGLRDDRQATESYFEEIFRRYHARVVSWCCAILKDREAALDLAQEVFLKVFRSIDAFRGDSRMSTWIYVITRNHCLNSLKKRETEPTGSAVAISRDLCGDTGADSYNALEQAQAFQSIFRIISSILTPLEIRILWLHHVNDLTLTTITRQLLLSNRSGAKAYLVSAKRKLNLHLRQRGITRESFPKRTPGSQIKSSIPMDEVAQYRAFAA